MSTAFARSTLSLRADGPRRTALWIVAVMVFLGAWIAWFLLGRVTVYEVSDGARVEVHRAAHAVDAPFGGRITAVRLALGQEVQAGEVLIELDTEPLRLEIAQKRARIAGITAQLAPVRAQIAAQERALGDQQRVAAARLEEARARHDEARAAAAFADGEAKRAAGLRGDGLLSDADALRAGSEAKARRAAADALRASMSRVDAEQRAKESEQRVELSRLSREAALLEGQRAEEEAAIGVLEQRIEDRRIKAPVRGRVGEVAILQVGSVLRDGDSIARVVPDGGLRVLAEFSEARAAGRVVRGQRARVRLDGFPWTQFGSVPATVTGVATELRDGRVRVELAVAPERTSAIPLQHGLPGTVEVEVERVSPAVLVLRAAGGLLSRGPR